MNRTCDATVHVVYRGIDVICECEVEVGTGDRWEGEWIEMFEIKKAYANDEVGEDVAITDELELLVDEALDTSDLIERECEADAYDEYRGHNLV